MKLFTIRKQFPLLKNNKVVYFDNAASTLKPVMVAKVMNHYNLHLSSNVGRGVYALAYESTKRVEDVRKKVAKFLNAKSEREIVFTQNTTHGLNMVASMLAKTLSPNDEIVLSVLEHHSNLLPWLEVSKQTGAKLVYVPLNNANKLTAVNLKKVLTKNTKVVAVSYVSNVTGDSQPIREICKAAHAVGALVVVDAAQAVGHFAIDVHKLGCDFLAFSGYKMFGPTGVGVLYGKLDQLEKLEPVAFGGGMVLDANLNQVQYRPAPEKFEAGTLPVASIIGLGEAIVFLEQVGYEFIAKQDIILENYFKDEMGKLPQVELYNTNPDIPLFAFNLKGIHAHDAATMYDQFHICVRAGSHCAQPLVEHMGQTATLRVSMAFYNTTKEIDQFVKATKQIIAFFSKF